MPERKHFFLREVFPKEEFAKLLNVEDIEEEEAELDSSISNPPDEPWPADSLLL